MDLQTRKLNAIGYLINLQDEKVFTKIEATIDSIRNQKDSGLKPFTKKQLIRFAVTFIFLCCMLFANFFAVRIMLRYGVDAYFYDKLLVAYNIGGANGLKIELDKTKNVHRSQFDSGAEINPAEILKKFVEHRAELTGGKLWIWLDNTGVVLYPFENRSCNAVYAGIRLMLDRMIFCIEESISSKLFSFKVALHVGNIEFKKRGETGEIVSDVMNTVFHLGQRFTDYGDFTVSREALSFSPPGYLKLFIFEGKYEGLQIYRLRRKN